VVAREEEEERDDVVAEAVFTGEDVEELALDQAATGLASRNAVLARLAKDLLVRDGPRDGRDWQGQNEQPDDL